MFIFFQAPAIKNPDSNTAPESSIKDFSAAIFARSIKMGKIRWSLNFC